MPSLSETNIKNATAPASGRQVVFDDHRDAPKGFGLRVTSAGVKAFIFRYKAKESGIDRLMTIGKWPTWSLAAARDQAREYKRRTDRGEDILESIRRERSRPTLQGAVEEYCTDTTDSLKSGKAIRSALNRYLVAGIGGKTKLADVRRAEVRSVVEALAKDHPRQAALLLTYTKGLFVWAEDKELILANPVATLKPAKIDKAMNPKKFQRGRVLDDEELFAFWEDVELSGMHRLTALCLKLILVTGQRPGEVAGMHTKEIKGDIWTIPESRRGKTSTPMVVPLTDLAMGIVEEAKAEVRRLAKRRGEKPAGFIFETRPGNSPAVNALDRAVKRLGNKFGNKDVERWGNWTPHDLRRTCRTGLAAAGVDELIAEQTIGHTRKGIAGTYDLHTYDSEKRQALEAWEHRLLWVFKGRPAQDGKVVQMRGRESA